MRYVVIYRTGGRHRFVWKRVADEFEGRELAQETADRLERMGYRALVRDAKLLASNGLPKTYEPC